MKTDSFFYKYFSEFPGAFFTLIGGKPRKGDGILFPIRGSQGASLSI